MTEFEKMLDEYSKHVTILEGNLYEKSGWWGCFKIKKGKPYIFIEHNQPEADKLAILVEEFKHFLTTVGVIINQTSTSNRKQELLARRLTYKEVIPVDELIRCYNEGKYTEWEIAEELEVQPRFLRNALEYFQTQLYTGMIYHAASGDYRVTVGQTISFYRVPTAQAN
ncbi:ImmA/IrrE family metallo-endopeptidase [Loigolactobacillus coryniformis]|uniref:ImmA/IrrE family metallo-endopeptidase n=1 Tax=Loigolactobacillus coryniformis TaxID=1610 RepID=UPI000219547B|nr:ImmA/IrrE family metallo-endopeptidase [Loigolactobacillus coryniformis]KRK85485.1 hypothetical protein FC16_GL001439 [Loigolactobacillus coryniformis subsp. torquens DSM 20004 = KCTC 3535]